MCGLDSRALDWAGSVVSGMLGLAGVRLLRAATAEGKQLRVASCGAALGGLAVAATTFATTMLCTYTPYCIHHHHALGTAST